MDDLKQQMKKHFIEYASYVILDRAIPNIVDGLKPVQRRILETLYRMHDGKLHKVANVVGQTMQLHPHGDAPIYEALVTLANKGYLLDQQGNFGNILTGDPPAAARYIETRLSPLAIKTLFNPEITEKISSYDGRNFEAITLPAKIPLLLLLGAEGIAVGMSTKIFPHNFKEVLEAEVAHLEGKPFKLYPDFPTGGIMDRSEYDKGRGKIKLRAKIKILDPKTLVIDEICYGTTTESLIRSIDEAAKKGKVKIESINDYTAEKVEIEIKLPRGQYAEEILESLYAFTECEVTLHSQIIAIKDNLPIETDVTEVLELHSDLLKTYLQKELELEQLQLLEKIFLKTLERIFIEHKIYKKIEPLKSLEEIDEVLTSSFVPFHSKLYRAPVKEDLDYLLQIPIRRISQFDISKNKDEVDSLNLKLHEVQKDLKNMKRVTIKYIKGLIEEYGELFPRKTRFKSIEEIDRRAIETKEIKIGVDLKTGFIGTKVNSDKKLLCTNFDKLLVFTYEGTYKIIPIPEKQFFENLCFVGVADKKTIFNIGYLNQKKQFFVKRFVVDKFIQEKLYNFLKEGEDLKFFETRSNLRLELTSLNPKVKLPQTQVLIEYLPIKGVDTNGVCIAKDKVKYKIFGK
jgi:topoisomerase-4 subunit A